MMIVQDIGVTRDFPKASRIGDYGQLRKIPCGINKQARACAIHEISGIETLADVRARPISRRHPQFCSDTLRTAIEASGIQYHWAGRQLGGMRKPVPNSPHTTLTQEGLRGYADYMDSENFKVAVTQLIRLAKRAPLAILCAERLPQHCHRSLIADYLTLHGLSVIHLLDPAVSQQHHLRAELRREPIIPVYDRLTQERLDLG